MLKIYLFWCISLVMLLLCFGFVGLFWLKFFNRLLRNLFVFDKIGWVVLKRVFDSGLMVVSVRFSWEIFEIIDWSVFDRFLLVSLVIRDWIVVLLDFWIVF